MITIERRQRVTQRGDVERFVSSNPGTRLVSVSERRTPRVGVRGPSPSRKEPRKRRFPKSARVRTAKRCVRTRPLHHFSFAYASCTRWG